jgi:hypothetical protein
VSLGESAKVWAYGLAPLQAIEFPIGDDNGYLPVRLRWEGALPAKAGIGAGLSANQSLSFFKETPLGYLNRQWDLQMDGIKDSPLFDVECLFPESFIQGDKQDIRALRLATGEDMWSYENGDMALESGMAKWTGLHQLGSFTAAGGAVLLGLQEVAEATFSSKPLGEGEVLLQWQSQSTEAGIWEIAYSPNKNEWQYVASRKAGGLSTSYSVAHTPAACDSAHYRLLFKAEGGSPVVVGQNSMALGGRFEIYPNPCTANTPPSLRLPNDASGPFKLTVYDVAGKQIAESAWLERDGVLEKAAAVLSGMAPGSYLIFLASRQKRWGIRWGKT